MNQRKNYLISFDHANTNMKKCKGSGRIWYPDPLNEIFFLLEWKINLRSYRIFVKKKIVFNLLIFDFIFAEMLESLELVLWVRE